VYSLPERRRHRAVRPSPIFLGFVGAAGVGGYLAWSAASETSARFGVFLFVLAGWVVSLCFHEFGHAYAAHRAGDDSVEAAGYLTLNPFKYAHPVLSILLPLFFILQGGIGLPGGAVYLHQHSFRTKAQRSLAAAAGPAINVIFAGGLLALANAHQSGTHLAFWSAVAFLGWLQVSAAVLNLLPIPGLDGYAIIEPYLDAATVQSMEKVKPWGMLGVIVLLNVRTINVRFFQLVDWLYGLSGTSAFFRSNGYGLFRFWNH
jgi:Zn-dependent protease